VDVVRRWRQPPTVDTMSHIPTFVMRAKRGWDRRSSRAALARITKAFSHRFAEFAADHCRV